MTSNLDPSWQDSAACIDQTWMTEGGNTTKAREVCRGCPVLVECKRWVMTDPNAIGIPGVVAGLAPEERGQVECGCGAVVPKNKTRRGQCWSCYTQAETFHIPLAHPA